AIASRLAASVYGLEIVDEGIEDLHNNYTRFFVVAKGDAPRCERAKSSLVFAVPNTPGALFAALETFAERQINLCKIESRPRRGRPWQYVFYLDFDGHWQDPAAADAIMRLLSQAAFVKLLGSYPPASIAAEDLTAQSELLQI
ncbi:MAG: prephenate dehydratase, partial [Caldilineaceae bacterium]